MTAPGVEEMRASRGQGEAVALQRRGETCVCKCVVRLTGRKIKFYTSDFNAGPDVDLEAARML